MTEKLKKIYEEEIVKLPKELQEAIRSLDWAEISEDIAKKYLTTESEINDFQVETMLILLGLEDATYYAQHIENNVGTTKEEANNMAKEAFEKIFTPIRTFLEQNIKKNMNGKNPDWKQSIDFILSGGDYSVFIGNGNRKIPGASEALVNPPTLKDIKSKLVI